MKRLRLLALFVPTLAVAQVEAPAFKMTTLFPSGCRSTVLNGAVKVTRNLAAYIEAPSSLTKCNANVARVGAGGALVLEAAATNQITNSSAFGSWTHAESTLAQAVVTSNAAAGPDGAVESEQIDFPELTATAQRSIVISSAYNAAAVAIVGSVWVKAASTACTVYLALLSDNWSGATSAACAATSSWTRCQLSVTATAQDWYLSLGPNTVNAGTQPEAQPACSVYVAKAQLETGSTATSNIDTTAAPVTRPADALAFVQ